jgi:hypothetical protein
LDKYGPTLGKFQILFLRNARDESGKIGLDARRRRWETKAAPLSKPSRSCLQDRFGFDIAGASNQVVVVDACTNLAAANWLPLQTNTLGTNLLYFTDSSWTNFPVRFYRVREP